MRKIRVKVGVGSPLVMKYLKISLFAIGALVALPMLILMLALRVMEVIVSTYLSWLYDVTDTDITLMD